MDKFFSFKEDTLSFSKFLIFVFRFILPASSLSDEIWILCNRWIYDFGYIICIISFYNAFVSPLRNLLLFSILDLVYLFH